MAREIEVVAAGEEQHLAPVDAHARRLQAVQHAHAPMGPALADPAEHLVGDPIERRGLHARTTSGRSG
ncbi:MAG: hypothetical protein R3F21_23155 [Myxococcota bacterium]